jgi:hypothetical protein
MPTAVVCKNVEIVALSEGVNQNPTESDFLELREVCPGERLRD